MARIFHLLKLMHFSKDRHYFHTFWVLVDDMIYAGRAFVATVVLIRIVIAIFAGLLNTVLGQDSDLMADPVLAELVVQQFGSFPKALLSLVQFVSADNIADLYFPLVVAKPELALLFAPLLIIVTVGLMGLVPLILFENKDIQKKRKQVERKELFSKACDSLEQTLMKGDKAEVDRDKIEKMEKDVRLGNGESRLVDLFDVLASKLRPGQEQPSLPAEEFIEALLGLVVFDEPLSQHLSSLEQLQGLHARINSFIERSSQQIRGDIDDLLKKIDNMQHPIDVLAAALSAAFRLKI